MGTRIELQSKLEELLGSRQVYYQPPETVKMEYPAIVYSKSNRYDVTVISKKPDDPVLDKLLGLQYCSYDRHYKSDNLNHDTFSLYF